MKRNFIIFGVVFGSTMGFSAFGILFVKDAGKFFTFGLYAQLVMYVLLCYQFLSSFYRLFTKLRLNHPFKFLEIKRSLLAQITIFSYICCVNALAYIFFIIGQKDFVYSRVIGKLNQIDYNLCISTFLQSLIIISIKSSKDVLSGCENLESFVKASIFQVYK